jgi:uncharacterized protein (DUF1778 family)
VAQKPKTEIKVRPSPEEKRLFELAAEKAKRSVSVWMTLAGLEKAERDGIAMPPAEKRKGGR